MVVTHIQSPHSYVVEFDDGSQRTIHANNLRRFHTKTQSVTCSIAGLSGELNVNSCAIVSEQDHDFWDIHVYDPVTGNAVNNVDSKLPSHMIDRSTLSHLSEEQQCELLQVLDKYNNCFSKCVIVKSGIRQGGILSPLLFNIYIDSLILGLKSSGLGCHMRGLYVGCIC